VSPSIVWHGKREGNGSADTAPTRTPPTRCDWRAAETSPRSQRSVSISMSRFARKRLPLLFVQHSSTGHTTARCAGYVRAYELRSGLLAAAGGLTRYRLETGFSEVVRRRAWCRRTCGNPRRYGCAAAKARRGRECSGVHRERARDKPERVSRGRRESDQPGGCAVRSMTRLAGAGRLHDAGGERPGVRRGEGGGSTTQASISGMGCEAGRGDLGAQRRGSARMGARASSAYG